MLLPSDVARLVLGYLQQEKLVSTCRSFIAESPNLREYAEHHTEEGTIPGCLLSLLGKNLTTILNEYITMKAKENQAEVPFMVSSLWKKLDLTLSQIRSMQESAAFNNDQRARTRKGINDRLRQRMLTSPLAVSGSPISHPVIHQTSTPIMAAQYILRPVHPPGALQPITSSSFGGESSVQNSNSTSISIVEPAPSSSAVCTQRKLPPPATASPMRRKQDVQRRRRAAPLSSNAQASDGGVGEDGDSLQAIIDGDFPQMVIENAREKILSNKSLQEKLAENINKFLGSDSSAQSSKQADGTTTEQDASIDEILGLQGGEMHMSEEAIHDILAQTELDPDFQELYDLFTCVTAKAPKMTPRDSSASNNDPKNMTGKGKKHNVVERVLDVESDSAPCIRKGDVCSQGKEGANKPDQCNGKSPVDQTSQLASTSKQACANVKHGPEAQTSSGDGQNTPLISTQSTDGDTAMDTSIRADVVANSQIEDTEIKEGAECGFLAEDVLPPNTVAADKSISTESLRIVTEEPKDISNPEVTVTMLKDTGKSDAVIPPQAGTPQKEKDNRVTTSLKQSPLNRPCDAAPDQQVNAAAIVTSAGNGLTAQNTAVNVELAACLAPETATLCSPGTTTSQPVLGNSSIVTINIIAEDSPEDAELDNAVNSINGDNYATIILSPLVKSQDLKSAIATQENAIIDLTDSSPVREQAQLEASSRDGSVSINAVSGDCTVYSVSGTSSSTGESNVIQIRPAASSTFAQTGNIFINSGPAMPSNIVMLSNSSASSQKQPGLFQTPPRPGSVYTMGQTMSPKLPQGSTIILASSVQPVLQGVMGMFPVSLVNQNGNTFTAPTHQILHVPVSKPIVPKLPLAPRSQKPALLKPAVNTRKPSNASADSSSGSSSGSSSSVVQSSALRLGNEGKRSESDSLNKPDDTIVPDSTDAAAAKELEAHRRVLCFDGTTSGAVKLGSPSSTNGKSKKTEKNETAPSVGSSSGNVSTSKSKENKKSESATSSVVKNPKTSTTSAASTTTIKAPAAEKRPAAPSCGTVGNKENVLQVETGNQRAVQDKRSNTPENEKNVKRPQETSKKLPASLPNILRRTPQKVPPQKVCPTSPLVKQASQLLQGMQFQSPTSKQSSQDNLPLPATPGSGLDDKPLDDHIEQTSTPTCKRYNEDGGTPKPMLPPATPDMPTCSPASEAGSENSVNMAAHTLMILSRASLAKSTGNTPLKDNTQQLKYSKSASKKRKLDEAEESERQSHKREHISQSASPKKKKTKKHRKKSADLFPAGMDVDKFLMSLHYDE